MPLIVCTVVGLLLALTSSASAEVYTGGIGAGALANNRGGESLAKYAAGASLDLGVGGELNPDWLLFGRLMMFSGIEDEQHAHDDVVLAASARTRGRLWGELGAGVGFYRGRYRYKSFFSADSAYDGDLGTPTLLAGGGITLHRAGAFAIDAHVDLTISLFGGEMPFVAVLHGLVAASWQR